MPLEVIAYKSLLPNAEGRYYMRTTRMDTVEERTVYERVAKFLGKYTPAEVEAIIHSYGNTIVDFAIEGRNVKSILGVLYLTAKGSLASEDDSYMPHTSGQHEISIKLRPSKEILEQIAKKAIVERVTWHDHSTPLIEKAIAVIAKTPSAASPGDVVRISGLKLGFKKGDENQGVFFTNGVRTRISKYLTISRNAVEIQLPADMPIGSYTLSVATDLNGNKLHEGVMDIPFIIA